MVISDRHCNAHVLLKDLVRLAQAEGANRLNNMRAATPYAGEENAAAEVAADVANTASFSVPKGTFGR